jgi:hypothetical protein
MSRVIVHRSEWVHSSQSKNKTQAEEQGKRRREKGKSQEHRQVSAIQAGYFAFSFAFLLLTFYFSPPDWCRIKLSPG